MKKEKGILREIIILRALACLSIVTLHTINQVVWLDNGNGTLDFALESISGLLSFGTPTFVLISIILLGYAYPDELPKGFYKKRFKFIFVPFLVMALFYGVIFNLQAITTIPKYIFYNVFGYYHGWFVLLIFQFYALYHFFMTYMKKVKPIKVLLVSFAINIAYLGYFTLTTPPKDITFLNYVWEKGFWVPFLGWIFYFAIAFYWGQYYREWLAWVRKHVSLLVVLTVLSLGFVLFNNALGIFEFGSKRIDMIFFTVSLITLLFALFSRLKEVPRFLQYISNYSFGIYLLHFFFIIVFREASQFFALDFGYWNILIWTPLAIASSIGTINFLHRYTFGKYIVGQIGRVKKPTSKYEKVKKKQIVTE